MFVYKFRGRSNYFIMREPFDSSKFYLINPDGIRSNVLRSAWTVFLGYANLVEHGSEFGTVVKSWESDSLEQLIRSISAGYPDQLLSKLIAKINDGSGLMDIDSFLKKKYSNAQLDNLRNSLVAHGVAADVADKVISQFLMVNKGFRDE